MMGDYEEEEQKAIAKLYLATAVLVGFALYALFT